MKSIPAYLIVASAAISGCIAVMLGAFGAHELRSQLAPSLMSAYQTGIQYHFYHTLALLLVPLLMKTTQNSFLLGLSALLFGGGIIVFSGSLYLLAILNLPTLGMLTPVGGVAFICGWLCLAFAAVRDMKEK